VVLDYEYDELGPPLTTAGAAAMTSGKTVELVGATQGSVALVGSNVQTTVQLDPTILKKVTDSLANTTDATPADRVFLNLACHDLATVIALYGEPTGVQHAELWGPPDHRGTFIYEYGPEARFVLTVALTDRSWFDQSLRLYTPTATADISWPSPFVDSGLTQARVQRLIDGEETVTTANAPSYQAFREELRDFLWAIVDGHAPRSPFSLGAAVLRWQFEALKLDHARRR